MPRKKNGGGGPPLIPIDGGKRGKRVSASAPPPPTRKPDIELPATFTTRRDGSAKGIPTRAIKSGALQAQVKAFYGVKVLTKLFNSLLRSLDADEPGAQLKAAKIYGLLSDGKGPLIQQNIEQNSTSDNRSVTINRSIGEASTPDEAYRLLAEEREKRKQLSHRQIDFLPTPDAGYEPKPTEG